MNDIIKAMLKKLFNKVTFALLVVFCLGVSLIATPLISKAYMDAIFEQLEIVGLTDFLDEGELIEMMKQADEFDRYLRENFNLEAVRGETTYLIFEPADPSADETVRAGIKSNIDYDRSVISWYIDGELQKSAYGLRFFDFSVGDIGESSVVRAEILTDSGIRKNITDRITPIEVDILWQASTLTPAPYKGKSLTSPTDKGVIEFIALPKFTGPETVEDPDNYIFSWKLNNTVVRGASGRGRDTFSVDLSDLLRRTYVSVEVTDINTGIKTSERISFPRSGSPEVLIYEKNKYGINYGKAIDRVGRYTPEDRDIRVVANPFHFTGHKDKPLEIDWSMNEQPVPRFENSIEAHFTVDRNFTGESLVSVNIRSLKNTREGASSEVIFSIR